jgi:trans-aconitate methyltransferase
MSYLETRYSTSYRPDPAYYRFKARRLMEFIRRFDSRPLKSFLDLGCGCGDLAEGMRAEFNLDVAGIERDETMARRAQDKKVGSFHARDLLEPLPEFKNRFNVVCSFEVFEHLSHADHVRALALYQTYGAKDAVGVIMVPNAAHPLLGGWLAWSDYTHRSCFTPESLGQMLRENEVASAKIFPWYSAGSSALLGARSVVGHIGGALLKELTGLVSTIPAPEDPFFSDALPLSSHLIAVFRIPS